MKLVIGGYAQGKLEYVLKREQQDRCLIYDGVLPDEEKQQGLGLDEGVVVINHLHQWIRERMLAGKNPEQELEAFVIKRRKCVIICDETGNGIVPMDAFEREYRERTGRILTGLAQKADEVVRVICGIGQRIK